MRATILPLVILLSCGGLACEKSEPASGTALTLEVPRKEGGKFRLELQPPSGWTQKSKDDGRVLLTPPGREPPFILVGGTVAVAGADRYLDRRAAAGGADKSAAVLRKTTTPHGALVSAKKTDSNGKATFTTDCYAARQDQKDQGAVALSALSETEGDIAEFERVCQTVKVLEIAP